MRDVVTKGYGRDGDNGQGTGAEAGARTEAHG